MTTDWQPIETAPKQSGRYVLLHGDGDAIEDCTYIGCWMDEVSDWVLFASDANIRPTHWQPLPEPPR